MDTNTMPADAQARLIEAATAVMKEQAFVPASESELKDWLLANAVAVGQRAIDLQLDMFVKYKKHQREIDSAISESVYYRIRGAK
jgi:hypothetical protein